MFQMTEEQYSDLRDESSGMCLKCKAEAYNVEPDARHYECEECGAREVFGIEELLLMGEIEFVSASESSKE
jgi:hypothetical protein